ncbi:DUF885 family protein [Runella slithyformis]|uniref:DUF885 domain-containing protein n=1 Tax=Runella slithyformis (strain ATCC 29530 / DSM 19594 / LMG 11500 / NCIMB 11436 / LSU 4) TaxID=761193 RepID=A0A7U3ZLA3_RUNSL|nr:DUF885 family protein [Runella slithyformis]AEI49266.1 protein of unknown function DUF885 [Runella slithyformis DSM 19594]
MLSPKPLLVSAVLTLTGISAAFAQPAPINSLYQQTSEVHHLMANYAADRGSLTRFYVIENSPERRQRLEKLTNDYLGQLQKMDFDKLPVDSQVDYVLFQRNLQVDLRELGKEATEVSRTQAWFPFADKIYAMEKSRRRGAAVNGEQIAIELNALGREIMEARKTVAKMEKIDPALAERAAGTATGLKSALKSIFEFYNAYDPNFTWWVPEPYKKVDTLLTSYATLFTKKAKSDIPFKEDGSGINGVAVGRDELIRQLEFEFISYTPEELIDIANKEFAWCDRELLKASREMGFGDDWKKAQEKVKNSMVPVGKQPEMILRLYNESVSFLKQRDLITIPPIAEETWRMAMMSAERQKFSPFFLGGETILISYPTSAMSHEDKLMSMRGNNPHFSRATVHHELIAGHHLQGFMNNRYKSYRRFRTPFWTEGWALYWEMILWDMNFPQSPEDRVGMLFWRMHRCARIIFSLNYHLGKWTPQQCIDFLVDRVGHERANAEGEVRRSFVGGYEPLYQLAYMTGAFQFYALKKELVDTKKMTYKQFHDAVMQQNSLPVDMVRAVMTNKKLSRDYKSTWKFYTPPAAK